jgi:hypothetical protein
MPFRREDWELGPAVTVEGLPRFVFSVAGNEGFSTQHFRETSPTAEAAVNFGYCAAQPAVAHFAV